MKSKNVLTFLILFFTLNFSQAAEFLCLISSDIDSSYAKLTYDWDDDKRGISHLYQETYENDKLTSKTELKIQDVNREGIVLLKKDKTIVVRLWSHNFDQELGGILYLDTLYSGVSGERRQYEFDIYKENDKYILATDQKNVFNKMKFIAKRSKILGIIGIEKILFTH